MLHDEKNFGSLVEPIIRQAGQLILSYYGKPLEIQEKEGNGFVTQADLASEKFLIEKLREMLPEAGIIAEESNFAKAAYLTKSTLDKSLSKKMNNAEEMFEQKASSSADRDYCWVIDPLDGTTNFANGLPYFCISIALTHKDVPVFGMIYQPLLDELFWAQKGKGAFYNGKKLTYTADVMAKSIIAIGLPYPKNQVYKRLLDDAWKVAQQSYAIRHFGAIALDLAYVAAGKLDGVLFEGLTWWDVAAGIILIKEAGGSITDYQGADLTPTYRSCVASTSQVVYKSLCNLVKSHN